MGIKIKHNDDRVRAAMTAILLITRDRLAHGQTDDLVETAMTLYRDDPEGYKLSKANWADAKELGPLTKSSHIAYYKNLLSAVENLAKKMEQNKRQSNSLLELDNFLVASLKSVRSDQGFVMSRSPR